MSAKGKLVLPPDMEKRKPILDSESAKKGAKQMAEKMREAVKNKKPRKPLPDVRLRETKETLKNPFYGINPKLSECPKIDADFEARKYTEK